MFGRARVATRRRPGEDGGRRDARLDPVRWRRPGRSALLRAAVVCALLVAAVSVARSRPDGCAPLDPAAAMTTATSAGVDPASAAAPLSTGGQSDPSAAGNGRPESGRPGSGGPDSSEPGGGGPTGSKPGGGGGPSGGGPGGGGQDPRRPAVPAGTVGVPVRLAEATALRLVHAGDRVDLVGVDPAGGSPRPVAEDALVLGVTGADDPTVGGLLLALDPAEARRTVGAPERTRFAVLIHPAR